MIYLRLEVYQMYSVKELFNCFYLKVFYPYFVKITSIFKNEIFKLKIMVLRNRIEKRQYELKKIHLQMIELDGQITMFEKKLKTVERLYAQKSELKYYCVYANIKKNIKKNKWSLKRLNEKINIKYGISFGRPAISPQLARTLHLAGKN